MNGKDQWMHKHANVKKLVNRNGHVLDVMSTGDLIKIWEGKTGREFAQAMGKSSRTTADFVSHALDAGTAAQLIKDLGLKGHAIVKPYNNKYYVIFKGYAGQRSIFAGTRYLATHPTVVDMAIGKIGVNNAILKGTRLTIFLVVPLNIVNCLLDDKQTMTELIGKTATDIAKIGVSTILSSLAATAAASVTTVAVGPIVVAIVVGAGATLALDALDKKYGLTKALVDELNELYDSTAGEFGRQWWEAENTLKQQILKGMPVGEGIFY